jgi:CopG family transcriptional regulator, nickel-responsive regulator
MPIVSISLSEDNTKALDKLQKAHKLNGRSEAVRVCIRSAEAEVRDRESLKGEVEGVLIVVHDSHGAPGLEDLSHSYQDVVATQIHSHLRNHKCLEVFIVRGPAGPVQEMIGSFQKDDQIDYVKFVQS